MYTIYIKESGRPLACMNKNVGLQFIAMKSNEKGIHNIRC